MSRIKKQINSKRSIPVHLKIESGILSPHLLNLRGREASLEKQKQEQLSFEEKVSIFDERIKEMPDFLKVGAARMSRLWKDRADSFFTLSANWGDLIQKKFDQTAQKTKWRVRKNRQFYPKFWNRFSQFAFMIILIVVVTIPLQAFLLYQSVNGFYTDIKLGWTNTLTHINNLKDVAKVDQIQSIQTELNALLAEVSGVRRTLDRLGPLHMVLPDKFKLADAGVRVAERGIIALAQFSQEILNIQAGQSSIGSLVRTADTELKAFNYYVNKLLGRKARAGLFKPLLSKINTASDAVAIIADLYGNKDPRHLLLIFQNPRELRATGGFAGSFALLTLQDGMIKSIETPDGGTYAIQGQLPLSYISPQPLQIINPRFEFQDANWWPEFPRSAKKIAKLFETAGGPTIDGVIAITAHVGEEVLKLHGPIQTEEGVINADNFIDLLQTTIARDRVQDRKAPKKIITALLPMMKDLFISVAQEHPQKFLSSIANLIKSKDIQIWARAEQSQAALSRLGLTGELKNTDGDYLAVITSNVGGGKTDEVVKETITHNVHIQSSNLALETIKIQRKHQGLKKNSTEAYRNVAYVRIYVPEQARFVKAVGNIPPPQYIFEHPSQDLVPDPEIRSSELKIITDALSGTEIWKESNKQVFAVWMITDPGEEAEVIIQYEVPLTTNGAITPYSLTVDPQGGKQAEFNGQITLDDKLKTLTGNAEGIWKVDGWQFDGTLDKTLVTAGIFYKL